MNANGGHPLAGRYVLIDQIGSGGMGSVWRAWDLRQQRFLAAKVLGQHDSGMLLRFVREQSVRIQHPHVVAPSGWAAEDNTVVFTMDLVRGGSIQTLLGDHGRLPESYVAVVLDQTLQALEAVHAAGVVHRDVKPANLLLEPTGTRRPHVRLGDFGIAALIDEVRLTRFPGAIGTEGYMAPEQTHGASPEPQQDLYALGVVAIQMLTGLSPRNQKGVPDGRLKPLIEQLTEVDSEKRTSSASQALQDLRAIGVPPGTPWLNDPEPPEVFDQLRDVPPPTGHPTYATPPGPMGQMGPPGAAPPNPPSAPAQPAHGGRFAPPGTPPGSGSGPGSAGSSVHLSPGGPGSPVPQGGPGSGGYVGRGSGGYGSGATPAAFASPGYAGPGAGSGAASNDSGDTLPLIAAIMCFVAALALAGSALWLVLA